MTRKSKAPSAIEAMGAGTTRSRRTMFVLACLCVLGLAAFLGSSAPSVGAAESFPGQGFLPDNRAWEMVSPPEKNGGDVMGDPLKTAAAVDGNAVSFMSLIGFDNPAGSSLAIDYMALRDGQAGTRGWSTHSLAPPDQQPLPIIYNQALLTAYRIFSADLSQGIVRAFSPLTGAPNVATTRNLYLRSDLRDPDGGAYQLLTDSVDPVPFEPSAAGEYMPSVAGVSSDFRHVVFHSTLSLTADAPACAEPDFSGCPLQLYEWAADSGAGSVSLVGQVPGASGTECGPAPLDPCEVAPSSAAGQAGNGPDLRYTTHTIAADGSRIFFTSPGDGSGAGNLYARVDGTTTVQLNATERTAPDAPQPAKYLDATPDGSMAFFRTAEKLTEDDDNALADLYRYSFAAPAGQHLTRLSVADPGLAKPVVGVIGTSEDGSSVYFVASGQLLSGHPDDAQNRVYLWRPSGLRDVGGLVDPDDAVNNVGHAQVSIAPKPGRVSRDGRFLLFSARHGGALLGFDHGSACGGLPCAQLYLYDAEGNGGSGHLACASCNAAIPAMLNAASIDTRLDIGLSGARTYLNRALSDDGTVFFNTAERLVPADSNGKVDVYEYDPATGTQRLMSSGESDSDSLFMDASPSGDDVFFITRQRLSRWDVDTSYDLYDARAGGGFPEPIPAPAGCVGDACQPAPPLLNDQTPASSSFSGPGDRTTRKAKVRRCAKGRHRRKVRGKPRCVKNRANANRRTSR